MLTFPRLSYKSHNASDGHKHSANDDHDTHFNYANAAGEPHSALNYFSLQHWADFFFFYSSNRLLSHAKTFRLYYTSTNTVTVVRFARADCARFTGSPLLADSPTTYKHDGDGINMYVN
jgi:hypothetical protein